MLNDFCCHLPSVTLTKCKFHAIWGPEMSYYQYLDPMLKIRRCHYHLIFNMGIPIPGKTVFILRRAPVGPFDCHTLCTYVESMHIVVVNYSSFDLTPQGYPYWQRICKTIKVFFHDKLHPASVICIYACPFIPHFFTQCIFKEVIFYGI